MFYCTLHAGDVRGAGSSMPAELQLIGSEGVSEPITFGDDVDNPGTPSRIQCKLLNPNSLAQDGLSEPIIFGDDANNPGRPISLY